MTISLFIVVVSHLNKVQKIGGLLIVEHDDHQPHKKKDSCKRRKR